MCFVVVLQLICHKVLSTIYNNCGLPCFCCDNCDKPVTDLNWNPLIVPGSDLAVLAGMLVRDLAIACACSDVYDINEVIWLSSLPVLCVLAALQQLQDHVRKALAETQRERTTSAGPWRGYYTRSSPCVQSRLAQLAKS